MNKLEGNKLHFAAWINWYKKAPELTFYNDEYDDYEPLQKGSRPRRRPMTETEEDYKKRLALWEAEQPRKVDVVRKGNSMRGSYYTKKLLPVYRDALNRLSSRSNTYRKAVPTRQRYNWYLQEDNDPSHGTKIPQSLPALYKQEQGLETFWHPPNSPDLNPIEAVWNILKERLKRYLHGLETLAEIKQALQEEWKAITIDQVRARIQEMPWRCGELSKTGGERIKSQLW
ncbi:hypothetical protein EJ04DRAFT_453448 [Polyplosphaeria fusca]|uniref:Tc1-like transposase DDE domain-containing protein n=1 Tax=Polyplosphaeria fusca TaxID=682080 RepID=A0A9P4QIZ3_9PLEO|nr:hypothetical protein EJ04DRAFT_453448 [Polyplosphaeria fusca]